MKNRRSRPAIVLLALFALAAGVVTWSNHAPTLDVSLLRADQTILTMLNHVETVPDRPNPPGYERDCGPGYGCVFGTAWKDVDRNGCDTRNDVLRAQLTEIVFKPGTRQCKVNTGKLRDPYTGTLLEYPDDPVEIDHIVPLAYAWDMGANTWPAERRTRFANDVANLIATSRTVNRAKSDKTPAEWAPLNAAFRCDYAKRFLTVASGYGLPITQDDADSIRATANACT